MTVIQTVSEQGPAQAPVDRLMFEATRRAEAMGLIEPGAATRSDSAAIRQLANRVRRAGIGATAADHLTNVEAPTPSDLVGLLEMMIAALEASPVPKFEWGGLGRVFGADDLAALLNVSASSLKRYQAGERATPDPVAAR